MLNKTGGRCHICGGSIERDEDWQANHVLAQVYGPTHSIDNMLPAHSTCNHYGWFFSPEEFQWILKLGVWLRTQVEGKNRLAVEPASRFVRHEKNRYSRRKVQSRQQRKE